MKLLLLLVLIFIEIRSSGQTTIVDERKFSMSVKNEIVCLSIVCDLRIPHLTGLRQDDVRAYLNDSLSKIAKQVIESINELIYFDYYEGSCDTSGIEFNPEGVSMSYHVWHNTDRLLSMNVTSGWSAGGGGAGFSSTEYFFNVDIYKNELMTIDSLFNSKNKIAAQQFVNKNIERLAKDQHDLFELVNDSINIFGQTDEENSYYTFIGFNIDSSYLILSYNHDGGRGNWSTTFRLPLKEIKPFINKEYSWIYSEKKNRN
jgi:hypothetical protein